MTDPTFGYTQSRPDNEPVPVIGADFSKTLFIETSEDASTSEYPLDTPKRISTSDTDAMTALGSGLLYDQVNGAATQLTGLNTGIDAIVLRVKEEATVEATSAKIADMLSGVQDIASEVNATPRIIVAGRTSWRPDLDTNNPVIAALPNACEKLLAVAPVDVDDTSKELAIDAREGMTSQRLMPVGVGARVYQGENIVSRGMASRVAGLFIRQDNGNEGKPFLPIANQPVYGLAGLTRNIPFSLLDGSTEGQQLLDADVSIVAGGEVNVDGAIASGGYYFIGTDNTDTGELWQQIHQVRGADYITVKLIQITREFLGKPITADIVEAYINSILFMLRDHKAANDILGYNPKPFIADQNSPEQIRLGRIRLDLGIEQAPVFKRAHNAIHRYRPAVEGLITDILNRLNTSN